MNRQTLLSFGKVMLLGGLSFWLPDALWHAIARGRDSASLLDLLVPNLSMPLALLCMYLFLKRRAVNRSARGVGLPLMVGVWTLGGVFMAIGASFAGGGFAGPGSTREGIEMILIAVIPVYTFIMATYDGSLGALLLATAAAMLIWLASAFATRRNRKPTASATNS
jgi:hypothetical protein